MWPTPFRRGPPVPLDDPERGSASVIVTGFGLLALLVSLTLCKALVVEHRAMEDGIASMRAYWAARGVENYVLSRSLQGGACGNNGGGGGNCDNPQQLSRVRGYLAELQPGTALTWQYPELGSAFQFTVATAASIDPQAPNTSTLGDFLLRSTFGSVTGAPQALRAIAGVRPVEFGFCLVSSVNSGCGGGPGGNSNTWPRITYVHRPAS